MIRTAHFIPFLFLTALFATGHAQTQGEGTNGDFVLDVQINAGSYSELDRTVEPGDIFRMRFRTPAQSAVGSGILLAADIRPVTQDYIELGVIGLNAGTRFVLLDSLFAPFPGFTLPTGGEALEIALTIPCSELWTLAPDLGFWIQAVTLVPGSSGALAGLYELSETIKTEVLDSPYPCRWYDSCQDAVAAPGLSDADLGTVFELDTRTASDDADVVVNFTIGTSTTFFMVPPGLGSSPDGLAAEGPSGDFFARFTSSGGAYTFDLCASDYDTRFWVTPLTCPGSTAIPGVAYNDDAQGDPGGSCSLPGHPFVSRLRRVCLAPGQEVLLCIDGFSGDEGIARLVITRETNLPERVEPAFGLSTGGSIVTILGCGLQNTSSVSIGGTPAALISATNSAVEIQVPAGIPGSTNVQISDTLTTMTLTDAFLYVLGTFSANAASAAFIPDFDPAGLVEDITVTQTSPLTSLYLTLHLNHNSIGELSVDLTSPAGVVVRVLAPTFTYTTSSNFQGTFPVPFAPAGGGPSTGPSGNFQDFLGVSPMGIWSLRVEDQGFDGIGTLDSWGLLGTF